MNFILPSPSLEHRNYVTIAIMLWSGGYFRGLPPQSSHSLKMYWKEIEEIVEEKAFKLPLAVILKERLLDFIRPVGLQILSWIDFNKHQNHFVTELPEVLVWTPHGTIDNKRTAELLVRDENLSTELRFKLACFYCLEDDVFDMWGKYNCRSTFYTVFWNYYFMETNDTRRKHLLLTHIEAFSLLGCETAVRYLCFQLKPRHTVKLRIEIAKSIAMSITYETNVFSDILYFLLSTMNAEQQTEVMESHLYGALQSLLVWPRQCLFLEAAKGKWDFLSKENYNSLLYDIIHKMNCKQNGFSEIFGEFWKQTPEIYKQFVTNGDGIDQLLNALRKKKDEKNIQLIMEYSSNLSRKKEI